jgi:hypothetical protein
MNDIKNKEIPLLLFETMSSFYKEDRILPYIDILIEKLL